jgi:hypothetical protein
MARFVFDTKLFRSQIKDAAGNVRTRYTQYIDMRDNKNITKLVERIEARAEKERAAEIVLVKDQLPENDNR